MGKGLAHRPDDLPVIDISSDFHLQGVPQRCPTYKPHTHMMITMIIIFKATLSALGSRWETPGEPMPNVFIPNVGIEKGVSIEEH